MEAQSHSHCTVMLYPNKLLAATTEMLLMTLYSLYLQVLIAQSLLPLTLLRHPNCLQLRLIPLIQKSTHLALIQSLIQLPVQSQTQFPEQPQFESLILLPVQSQTHSPEQLQVESLILTLVQVLLQHLIVYLPNRLHNIM